MNARCMKALRAAVTLLLAATSGAAPAALIARDGDAAATAPESTGRALVLTALGLALVAWPRRRHVRRGPDQPAL